MGRVDKADWISSIRVANEIGFVMFQESQLESMLNVNLDRFWGRGDFDVDWVDATGRSGGIVSMWDKKVFHKLSVHKHRNVLVVHGFLKNSGVKVGMVNVYAPQKIEDKRVVWLELDRILQQDSSYWIVGGDFNCVRDRSERKSSKFNAASTNEFNEFLDGADLHEYGLRGRKFTFVSGNKCSRIDRIFVSLNFLNKWPNAEYRALARGKSDHSPLVLKVEYRNYGPKPFKFFNSWLDRDGFEEVVSNAANRFSEDSVPDIFLLHKLKYIRGAILKWKSRYLKVEEEELHGIQVELEELDKEVENRDLTEDEQWTLCEGNKRLREIEVFKQKDLRQKARVKWARDGDENSSFFHGVVNKRRVSNCIPGVMANGVWISKPTLVKREVFSFFRNKFVEDMVERPKLVCEDLKTISEAEADYLVGSFTKKEVKEAVFECGSDKAPGPDGFNFRFIKRLEFI
ncbi:uncharacterized protein LOC110913577 [Helianthus annuus]|uniref:uncharacterized protein LOC110913577 n=1 Tax=Helianthus annuus TaxID=4232 RepID=UPI000B9002CA|nr:uncharacterized protein LOC110913577 [Helianthus annuus]